MADERPAEHLDHVARPMLPWRVSHLTECGLSTSSLPVIDVDTLIARIGRLGQRRTALGVCMTCWTTASHSKKWDIDPVSVMEREVRRHKPKQLERELRAIAALINAHREEFDTAVAGLAGTPSLAEHRRNRRQGRTTIHG